MNKSENIKEIASALAAFNGEVSHIVKDAKNPFFKSQYASLDKLIEETRDALQQNGLSVMQFPLSKETGEIGVQSLLLHTSGEYIEGEPIYMKPAKANDPQAAGSIISYMRRYSYQAILNLNTGEDDDANKASGKNTPSKNDQKAPQRSQNKSQVNVPVDLQNHSQGKSDGQKMTLEQAKAFPIGGGQFKGKTIGEVAETNPQYLLWIINNTTNAAMKAAAIMAKDNK